MMQILAIDVRPNVTGGRDYAVNLNQLQPLTTTDTITKFTVTWTPNDDMLFYVTTSEGYRPPGFNRGAAANSVYDPAATNTPIMVSSVVLTSLSPLT